MFNRTLLVQSAEYTIAGRDKEKRVADTYFTINVPEYIVMYRQKDDIIQLLQKTVEEMQSKNSADRYEIIDFEDYPPIKELSTPVFMGINERMVDGKL